MGYEVDVRGTLEFFKPFEEFEKDVEEKFPETYANTAGFFFKHVEWNEWDDDEFELFREGKLWYNDQKAMEFLAKYANGTVYFYGEDNESWKYVLKDGEVEKFERGAEW